MTLSNLDATVLFPYPTELAIKPPQAPHGVGASQAISGPGAERGTAEQSAAQPLEVPAAALTDSVQKLNIELQSYGVQFEISEIDNRLITRVIERESGELIRQIPSEEVLRIARSLEQSGSVGGTLDSGLLVQTTA